MVDEGWETSDTHVHQGLRGTSDNTFVGTELFGMLCGIHQPKKKKALISEISGRVVSQQQLYKQVLLAVPL